jgi:signal transduction histidine kinase
VLASIADAFYLLDHEWRFTYVNDAAEPLLQTTRDKLLGHTLWEMFPGVIGSPFEGPYREAMATGRVTSAEAYFPPLGTWFDVRTYPWEGGLMVHFRDIGQRKHAEAERDRLLEFAEEARRDAEAASRAKSEFLAVMSHELRTPLNAIGGYAELMELGIRGPITAEQRSDLARIQQSQRHLLGLINGVLNYARVEAGAVHYALSEVQVEEALSACEALVMPQLRSRDLTLDRQPCDPKLMVRADSEKLQQILLNLLSNAVKFTEPGGAVTIRCSGTHDAVRIEVTDTGIGIAEDQLARVFEPFVQVDAKLTRTREGTGLGLAISRDLARGMGGDITATSEPGVGSTFTLVLPRSA